MDLRKDKILDLKSVETLQQGAAYVYTDATSGKRYVAKFMANYDDEDDARLLPEFRKMMMLSSEPEMATVYYLASGDYGEGAKSCYIMDWVDGLTLDNIVREKEPLGFDFVVDTLTQIASAIEKAHHYEIAHGDLHEKNVMIDRFGYVKVIDFAWWVPGVTFKKDIEDFKSLVRLFEGKLSGTDRGQFQIIRDYLLATKSLKDVARNMQLLLSVSQDLSLMDDPAKQLLAVMINSIRPEANYMYVLNGRDIPVPVRLIPALSEQDQEDMERDRVSSIGPFRTDKRSVQVQQNVDRLFKMKLHQLQQAGFIGGEWGAHNIGEKYLGPYRLWFQLFLKSKIFEWKRLNQKIRFLPEPQGQLVEVLLSEL